MAGLIVRAALAAWLLVLPASALFAQDAAVGLGLTLSSPGAPTRALTRDTLARLPAVMQDAAFMTSKGISKGHYKGTLLWDVFRDAGLVGSGDKGMHEALRKTFAVVGRDGYEVDFSLGEIAPDFGDTPAMIAWEMDGRPLPAADGLRLIVPGDKRGARDVRDVASITLR